MAGGVAVYIHFRDKEFYVNAPRFLIFGLLATAPVVLAQETHNYDGNWIAKYTSKTSGRAEEATLVIKGKGGTWQNRRGFRKQDRCIGLEFPIEVTRATPTELELKTYGSKVLTGCNDDTLAVKRIDDKTLEGIRNESPITFTRQ